MTEHLQFERSSRGFTSFLKFYPWAYVNHLRYEVHCESGASPFYPGLEVFKAVQSANDKGLPVHFMGGVFNEHTLSALSHERRMHLIPQLWRLLRTKRNYESMEISDLFEMINIRGLEQMSEHLDDKHMGVLVYDFGRRNPFQKNIMVDQENVRLFKHIFNHMEGRRQH